MAEAFTHRAPPDPAGTATRGGSPEGAAPGLRDGDGDGDGERGHEGEDGVDAPAERAEALRRRLASTPPPAPAVAIALRRELAGLLEARLGRAEEALRTLERALADSGGADAGARDDLVALCERQGMWERCATLVADQVASESGDTRARAAVRLARLRAERLDDLPGALVALEQALDAATPAGGASAESARALETFARGLVRWTAPSVVALRRRAAERLLDHARGAGAAHPDAGHQLDTALDVLGSAAAAPGALTALAAERARHQRTGLARPELAFLTAVRALEGSPRTPASRADDAALLTELAEAADAAQLHEEEAATLGPYADDPAAPAREQALARLAHVLGGPLGRAAEALERLAQLGALRPDDAALAQELAARFQTAGRWPEAERALAGLAARAGAGDPAFARLHCQRARILHERLGQAAAAADAYRVASDAWPEDVEALRGHVAAATALDSPPTLGDALERLARAPLGAESTAAWLRLAVLCEGPLADPRRAAAAYEAALRAVPNDPPALAALGALYERLGDAAALRGLVERRAEAGDGPSLLAPLRLRLARVLRAEGALDGAIAELEAALAAAPADVTTLEALVDALRAGQRWEPLTEHLGTLAAATADATSRAERLLERATTLHERLGRADAAAATLRAALPRGAGRVPLRSLRALCALADRCAPPADLAQALRLLALEPGLPEDERAATWRRLGALREGTLGDATGALEALDAAAEAAARAGRAGDPAPADPALAADRIRLCRALGRPAALASLLEERLCEEPPAERRRTLLELAELRLGPLARPDLAFEPLCEALRLEPQDAPLAARVEALGVRVGRVDALVALFEALAAQARAGGAPARAAALARRLAALAAGPLADPEAAARHLEAALAADPDSPESDLDREALVARHVEAGRPAAAARHLATWAERSARAGDPALAADRLVRAAELLVAAADAPAKDAGPPLDPAALARRAWELAPGHAPALGVLEPLLAARGEWPALAALVEQAARREPDEARAVARLHEAAMLHHHRLASDAPTLALLREVLRRAPGHVEAHATLEARLTRREDWPALVAALRARLEAPIPTGPEELARLHATLAGVLTSKLGRADDALPHHEALLALADRGPAPPAATLTALATAYRARGDAPRLARVLQRWAEAARTPLERAERLVELAAVRRDALGDRAGAEAALRAITGGDAAALAASGRAGRRVADAAFDAHEALTTEAGQWRALLQLLERRATLPLPAVELATLHARRGRLLCERLGDAAEGRRAYERALELDPSRASLAQAVGALAHASGDAATAMRMAVHEAELATEPHAAAAHLVRAALLARDRLSTPELAERHLVRALALHPDRVDAAHALALLRFERGADAEALGPARVALAGLLEEAGPAPFVALAVRLGEACLEAGDAAGAVDAFTRARQLDTDEPRAERGLGAALLAAEDWERARLHFTSLLAIGRDARPRDELLGILTTLGTLHGRLDQADRALAYLEQALALDPAHAAALEAVATVEAARGGWEAVYTARRALIDTLPAGQRRASWVALGDLARRQLGDDGRAIEAWERAVTLNPRDLVLLDRIAQTHLTALAAEPALHAYGRIADALTDPARKAEVHVAMGRTALALLDDDRRAEACFEAALDADPTRFEGFEALEEMLVTRQQHDRLEIAYVRMLQRIPEADVARRELLWRTLGDFYRKVAPNARRASEAYRAVVGLAPTDARAWRIFAETLEAVGSHDEARVAWQAHAALATDAVTLGSAASALCRLHAAAGALDAAFTAASAQQYLESHGAAPDAGAARLYAEGLPAARTRTVVHPLDATLWDALMPDALHGAAATLCAEALRVSGGRGLTAGRPPEARRSARLDVERDPGTWCELWRQARAALAVPTPAGAPELYGVEPGDDRGVRVLAGGPPVVLVPAAALRARPATEESLFRAGRALGLTHPRALLACALTPPELEVLLAAIAETCLGAFAHRAPEAEVAAVRSRLGRALRGGDPALAAASERWASASHREALRELAAAAHELGDRAGYFVTGSLSAVDRAVRHETSLEGVPPPDERMVRLARFATSPLTTHLRAACGLSIEV